MKLPVTLKAFDNQSVLDVFFRNAFEEMIFTKVFTYCSLSLSLSSLSLSLSIYLSIYSSIYLIWPSWLWV